MGMKVDLNVWAGALEKLYNKQSHHINVLISIDKFKFVKHIIKHKTGEC